MDVVVELGGWEHECCGEPVERNQLVDFRCIRHTEPDGRVHLVETHHGGLDVAADERVRGRVTDIQAVQGAGAAQPVLRVPGGPALRGFDDDDDGHLEDPWTGEVITSRPAEFLVTVRTAR
ncbi:DUF6578 domain-containing protein [Modestobacter sp. SYSU DS0875]